MKQCQLVIRFDLPSTLLAFVQSRLVTPSPLPLPPLPPRPHHPKHLSPRPSCCPKHHPPPSYCSLVRCLLSSAHDCRSSSVLPSKLLASQHFQPPLLPDPCPTLYPYQRPKTCQQHTQYGTVRCCPFAALTLCNAPSPSSIRHRVVDGQRQGDFNTAGHRNSNKAEHLHRL